VISEQARRLVSESRSQKPLLSHVELSLDGNYICSGDSNLQKKGLVYTYGLYWIKFKPGGSYEGRTRLYSLNLDVMTEHGKFIRVRDYDDLVEWGSRDERIAWILKHTNVSRKLFEIAKKNKYVPIPFSIKMEEYYQSLEDKYRADHDSEPNYGLLADPILTAAETLRLKAYLENARELRKLETQHKKEKDKK